VQEIKLVKYPYFVDIRPDGMNSDSITGGLNQLTLNWASPIAIDQEKNKGRKVLRLLESSDKSWLSTATEVQPNFKQHGELGFPIEGKQEKHLLAAAVEGSFSSYFAGKPSPLLKKEDKPKEEQPKPEGADKEKEKKEQVIVRQIDKSPDTARIILFASGSFLSDQLLGISSSVMRSNYTAPVHLAANAVDWSLEDRGLLAIRGRSHFSRPLNPISKKGQILVEYLNYGLALLGLAGIWLLRATWQKRARQAQLDFLRPLSGRVSSCFSA
jgi:ABC-2 type transport system permease protein